MFRGRYEGGSGPGMGGHRMPPPHQRKRSGGGGDDLSGGLAKRAKTDGVYDLRFLIPSQRAGAIIGKSGKQIVELRTTYNCKLVVPDCEGVPERLMLVRVNRDLLPKLLNSILQKLTGVISTNSTGGSNASVANNGSAQTADGEVKTASTESGSGSRLKGSGPRAEVKLLLHQKEAVALIGKGGTRIKEIREKTTASIKIFDKTCPLSSDKVVRVAGTIEVVADAIRAVCEALENEDVQIAGDHFTYDPANYEPYSAYEWGGMDPSDENFALSSNPRARGGRGGGGMHAGPPPPPPPRDWVPVWGPPDGGPPAPPPQRFGGTADPYGVAGEFVGDSYGGGLGGRGGGMMPPHRGGLGGNDFDRPPRRGGPPPHHGGGHSHHHGNSHHGGGGGGVRGPSQRNHPGGGPRMPPGGRSGPPRRNY